MWRKRAMNQLRNFNLLLTTICIVAIFAVHNGSPAHSENPANLNIDNNSNNETIPDDQNQDEMAPKDAFNANEAIVRSLLNFTGIIYNKIRKDDKNVLLSPLSIHAALSMLALGAEPNSTTDKELRNGLQYSEQLGSEQLEEMYKAYKHMIEHFKKISKLGLEALERAKQEAAEKGMQINRASNDKPPVIEFFNTIITKSTEPLQEQYSARSREFFQASVEPIDQKKPETIKQICDKTNKWAKDAGFEEKILQPSEFSGDFAGMLLSAVRVQAFWFKNFEERSRPKMFYNFRHHDKVVDGLQLSDSDIHAKLVEFCPDTNATYRLHHSQIQVNKPIDEDLRSLNMRAIAIQLQGKVNLVILEPREGGGDGRELGELSQKLFSPPSKLAKVLQYLDRGETETKLGFFGMPKFGFENDIDLKGPLKSMGINKIFDKNHSELKKILKNQPVVVDTAKHQAMIEVNKHGLKAAGVTKIRLALLMASFQQERIYVELKNPFIFLIRYEQTPLFVGHLVKLEGNK